MQDRVDLILIALDVEPLYPSVDINSAKKTIYNQVFRTKVIFKDIEHRETAEYVAATAKPWEISLWKLHNIISRKRTPRGRKPCIAGKYHMTSISDDKENPWEHPKRSPTQSEMRSLLAAATGTFQPTYLPVWGEDLSPAGHDGEHFCSGCGQEAHKHQHGPQVGDDQHIGTLYTEIREVRPQHPGDRQNNWKRSQHLHKQVGDPHEGQQKTSTRRPVRQSRRGERKSSWLEQAGSRKDSASATTAAK